MRRFRTLLAFTVLAFVLFVATALAVEWAGNGYYLASGQSGYLNHTVTIQEASGRGENRAVCAGIRYYGDDCVGRGSTAAYIEPYPVLSEPYLHNHDTEGGYFHGYYLE
jgi:hypothetical protein